MTSVRMLFLAAGLQLAALGCATGACAGHYGLAIGAAASRAGGRQSGVWAGMRVDSLRPAR